MAISLSEPTAIEASIFIRLAQYRERDELKKFLLSHKGVAWSWPMSYLGPQDKQWLAEHVFTDVERHLYRV